MRPRCDSPRLLVLATLLAVANPGCNCAPTEECQVYRALCKIDLCVRTDPEGWYGCQALPDQCDPIEGACTTRAWCIERFMTRCTERMAPGRPGYAGYSACAHLDCAPRPAAPPPMAGRDAVTAGSGNGPAPDAARPERDAAPGCAGVMCGGACCTAYPCFSSKRCTCESSVSACVIPDAGAGAPPLSPACCSDAPLCSAQNKQCCFLPATSDAPAQTRCLTKCPEARHCTFAPYLQTDGARSCLPPPYDTAGILCPF